MSVIAPAAENEQSEPLPAEAVNAQGVRAFERYVGVPVSPGNFERAGAHLVGGRILSFPMRAQRAAMIRYVVGSGPDEHHISVLIYDAQKLPEVGRANLAPRAVGYVACDPAALARDVATASAAGWRLEGLRAFDAFPMTHHIECVAVLVR